MFGISTFVAVDSKKVTKEILYDNYVNNKGDFEKASKKVKKASYLPNVLETVEESTNQSTEESVTEEIVVTDDDKLNYFKNYVLADTSPSITEFHKQQVNYGVDENHNKMIRYGGGLGAYATVEGSKIIYEIYSFGGVHDDGTVEKTFQDKAFYDVKTGEHGLLNN